MHFLILELVSLSQAAREVDHGLYGHATLDGLVAAVQLGHRFLDQRHPELVGVGAAGVAVGARALGQSVVDEDLLPVAVAPDADLDHPRVARALQHLIRWNNSGLGEKNTYKTI